MELDPDEANCPTCNAPVNGPFCSQCGEKALGSRDLSLAHLTAQWFEALASTDNRLWRTLRALLRPGFLSCEYLRGARRPYLSPIQLFLIAGVAYFLIQPHTGVNTFNTSLGTQLWELPTSGRARSVVARKLELSDLPALRNGPTSEETRARIRAFAERYQPKSERIASSLVILMAPMFACALALIFAYKRRWFAEHLLFALHFLCFHLFYVCLLLFGGLALLVAGLRSMGLLDGDFRTELTLSLLSLPWMGSWLVLGFRRFYGTRLSLAIPAAALALGGLLSGMWLYRWLLFEVTVWMLGT